MHIRSTVALSCLVVSAGCAQTATSQSSLPATAVFEPRLSAMAAYKTVYSFKGAPDGDTPNGDIIYQNGAFYGSTSSGGANNAGTLVKVLPSGRETLLYSFAGGAGGNDPDAGVVSLGGAFYGTTSNVAYRVTADGKETALHAFGKGSDGNIPVQSPMVAIGGKLYGATELGGSKHCNSGCGVIFGLTTGGSETVVYAFQGAKDGYSPLGSLIDAKGVLYGTTSYGGTDNGGTVFKLTSGGTKTILYSFKEDDVDGERPSGNLIDVGGVLYGTTAFGGTKDLGTVYSLNTSGKETVLHTFIGGTDGAAPNGSLV
ncbi:MAG TPA: choice-of-anchor tandem repeat GloVer-containing protein, partial [Candidatus Tumulicola sp.]